MHFDNSGTTGIAHFWYTRIAHFWYIPGLRLQTDLIREYTVLYRVQYLHASGSAQASMAMLHRITDIGIGTADFPFLETCPFRKYTLSLVVSSDQSAILLPLHQGQGRYHMLHIICHSNIDSHRHSYRQLLKRPAYQPERARN